MKLAISLATRGRPQQLVNTIKRSIVNWTDPNTVMYVQADDDDQATYDAIKNGNLNHDQVRLSVKPREDTIAAKWNRIMSQVPDADVYSIAADDDPYTTPGYDSKILEAAKLFPDGVGMVYGAMANLSFTGSLSMTNKMAKRLGYVQPEYFPYWFCDHWTDDVAKMIGRISYADIKTDQSSVGKTQELREPAWWATFFDAMYLVRRREARGLIDSPDFAGEEWQKELLRNNHPLIEQRSRGVNESVRQTARQLEGWSGLTLKEERYQRVRQKAAAMVPGLLADPEMLSQERAFFASILTPPTQAPALQRAYA